MQANHYFSKNIRCLVNSPHQHEARAKYKDGSKSLKTSIYQVFEKYDAGVVPVHTYRNTAVKMGIQEVMWIYQDQTSDLQKLRERGVNWWDSFDVGDGTIGTAYGNVVSHLELMDSLLHNMENNPFSQRHILMLWDEYSNQYQYHQVGLVPCVYESLYSIVDGLGHRSVNMHINIRSSDYITAGAINRVQYYCLGLMICGHLTKRTGIKHKLGTFSVFTNDMHIYDRHYPALIELMKTEPAICSYKITLDSDKMFYDYTIEDFSISIPKGIPRLENDLELAV